MSASSKGCVTVTLNNLGDQALNDNTCLWWNWIQWTL